ncbi:MAG: fructose-specific PTS transporter subunit EIIC [Actinomycetales bacterium]
MNQPIITTDLVSLDANIGATKDEVIAHLAGLVAAAGRASSAEGLIASAMEREAQSATGLPGGIGIPHCRSEAVNTASLGFARLDPKVDFGAPDGPADLVFLIAAPAGGGQEHLQLLTKLARSLVRKEFTQSLRDAATKEELVQLVMDVVEPAPEGGAGAATTQKAAAAGGAATAAGGAATATSAPSGDRYLVAITACPTGIAHTYMAADSLAQAGDEMGVPVKVETQGSSATTPLEADVIKNATGVIFATDVGVKGRERFAGLPVVASGVKRAINEPKKMIEEALAHADNPNGPRVEAGSGAAASSGGDSGGGGDVGFGTRLRQVLMTGVSYMIPFVAAGGLLIALGFLVGGYSIANVADSVLTNFSPTNLPSVDALVALADEAGSPLSAEAIGALPTSGFLLFLGAALFKLGGLAFGFLVPALAGYIAFGIADRPGIAPGFLMGSLAVFTGGGFIGGLIGGLMAGYVALKISQLKVPRWLAGLMPVVIIPLGTSLIVGLLYIFLLARPTAAIQSGLTNWLNGLTGASAILLGVILGLMMCFDLGGPVNKAAYTFATAGLSIDSEASMQIMAAVMAAGMVPPLAMALATTLRPQLFTEPERENGKAAWLLGASFISEGAIPFAASDPLRVIPPCMVGGAITGAMVMATGVTLKAPHGGIFVFFAMGRPVMFFVSLIVGFVVAGLGVVALKSAAKRPVPVAA